MLMMQRRNAPLRESGDIDYSNGSSKGSGSDDYFVAGERPMNLSSQDAMMMPQRAAPSVGNDSFLRLSQQQQQQQHDDAVLSSMMNSTGNSSSRLAGNFQTPDLYQRSPQIGREMVSVSMNAQATTNTSPMQRAAERVTPGNRMDHNMRLFLNKMAHQSTMEKEKSVDAELDMNLPFPVKLHYMLSNPKYRDCIAWLPHGRAWRIVKPKAFEKLVIPKFFRSAKYASFMRQVNGWAFSRITEGPDLNAYYHEMFLRGIPSLCFKMKRPPKVKSAAAAARNASGAGSGIPDFYRISKIAPLPPATPFRPVVQETKTDDDCPRYEIETLKVEETTSGGGGSPLSSMVQWPDPEPADGIGVLFSNPFEEEAAASSGRRDSSSGKAGVAGNSQNAAPTTSDDNNMTDSIRSAMATTGGSEEGAEQDEKTEEATIQELSKADIRYLAHQNQILLKHVEGESSKDESLSQASTPI